MCYNRRKHHKFFICQGTNGIHDRLYHFLFVLLTTPIQLIKKTDEETQLRCACRSELISDSSRSDLSPTCSHFKNKTTRNTYFDFLRGISHNKPIETKDTNNTINSNDTNSTINSNNTKKTNNLEEFRILRENNYDTSH